MRDVLPLRFRPLSACVGLLASVVLAGCAQVYDVKVDALQNPEIQSGHSYRLVTKAQGGAPDGNQQRAETMVRKALAGHGMYESEDPEKAEVTVEVAYEVGPKRVVVQPVDPMAGTIADPMLPSDRRIIRDASGRPIALTDNSAVILREVYEKKLTIVAREGPAAETGERPPRELWRVEVKVDDEKDTVDEVLPVLVGAAVDHIGTDSATQQTKRVSDKSEPVNFVTSGG
ncbi:MAG: hypothetical protein IAE82_01245 [Opitutaceae bacterium]|nr:hypothetical protein [Opitutaceae bacterium]